MTVDSASSRRPQGARKEPARGREKREHVRLVPTRPEEFRLVLGAEGLSFEARLLDYSPFGLGALVPADDASRAALAPGRMVGMRCVFGSSRFPSKGRVVSVAEVDAEGVRSLRVGFALVSESSPSREKLSLRRSELRLELDDHLSPLCVCDDEMWLGERVFMRARDLSAGGLALDLPSPRVPFLPKQRLWLRILVPFFGEFKACVRVAYVKPVESAAGERSHLVGVGLLRSDSDLSRVLGDWLFLTHPEFDRADLRAAGFDVSHLGKLDSHLRARIVTAREDTAGFVEDVEFCIENAQGDGVAHGLLRLSGAGARMEVVSYDAKQDDTLPAFLKFLVLFADVHAVEDIAFGSEVRSALRMAWPGMPDTAAGPLRLLSLAPVPVMLALSPLFRKRLPVPAGPRGAILKTLSIVQGFVED